MASIREEILLDARAEDVWDAVRDVGALHTRLVPGFVTDTRLEKGARIVTFANGMVVRELIVDLDDTARRLVWTASGGRLSHHRDVVMRREQSRELPSGRRLIIGNHDGDRCVRAHTDRIAAFV